jgi:hypothetical protein
VYNGASLETQSRRDFPFSEGVMSMKTDRRRFLAGALVGSAGAALSRCAAPPAVAAPTGAANYAKLDDVLKQPVLKRQLFSTPVIIETLELLRLGRNFLCRVRSKDGAEGISAANNSQQRSLYPIQVNRLQPFFIGKDARDLETLLEDVYVYQSNYKLQSLALWVPLATFSTCWGASPTSQWRSWWVTCTTRKWLCTAPTASAMSALKPSWRT